MEGMQKVFYGDGNEMKAVYKFVSDKKTFKATLYQEIKEGIT